MDNYISLYKNDEKYYLLTKIIFIYKVIENYIEEVKK